MGLLGLLGLLAAAGAQANLKASVTQSPQNPVTPGQAVTYSISVTSDASQGNADYPQIDISDGSGTITDQFSTGPLCGHDGTPIYCSGVSYSSPQTYQVTWNNPAPKAGTYQLTIQLSCGSECVGPSPTIITVISAPPVANDVAASTQAGKTVNIDVLAKDSDPANETISVASVTQPADGKAAVVNDGAAVSYTPNPSFTGTDRFIYTIRNTDGATASATVAVTVSAGSGPVATADSVDTDEGAQVTIKPLTNDQGQSISITSVSKPANGTAVIGGDGTTIEYTPKAGFSGTDPFTYTISDATGQTSTATVTVYVKSTSRVSAQATTRLQILPGLTANQHSVAVAIDGLCASSTDSQVQNACGKLNALSPSDQVAAVQQITPDQVASQGTNAIVTSHTQLANIRMRLMALRQGLEGFSVNNLSMNVEGQNVPAGRLLASLLKAPNGGGAGADSGSDRLGAFVNGRFNFGSRATTSNETGFSFNTEGVTAGVDYRFTDRLVAGTAFGFASTGNDFSANAGNMTASDYSFSTYGSYYLPREAFVDWILTYTTSNYDIAHNIAFPGFNTQTKASVGGNQLALALNAGQDFHRGGLTLTPYARVEYIKTGIDPYQEGNGKGLGVVIDHQSLHYLTSVLAGRASKAVSMSWGILSPSVHVEWVHQYDNNSRLIGGHFIGDPSASFAVKSDSPDRNYFNAGFGVAVTLPRGISAFFNYETVLARNHVHNTLLQVGGRMQF